MSPRKCSKFDQKYISFAYIFHFLLNPALDGRQFPDQPEEALFEPLDQRRLVGQLEVDEGRQPGRGCRTDRNLPGLDPGELLVDRQADQVQLLGHELHGQLLGKLKTRLNSISYV